MAVKQGNANANQLPGTAAVDLLLGGDGNDRLDGKGGNDFIIGQFDNDTLLGGDGNDLIIAADGRDIVNMGNGNDILLTAAWNRSSGGVKDGPPAPALISADGGAGRDYLLLDGSFVNVPLNVKLGSGVVINLPGGGIIKGFETGFIGGTLSDDKLTGVGWTFSDKFPIGGIFSSLKNQINNTSLRQEIAAAGIVTAAVTSFDGMKGDFGDDTLSVSIDADSNSIASGLAIEGGNGDDVITLTLTGAAINALKANDGKFGAPQPDGTLKPTNAVRIDGGDDSFGTEQDIFNFSLSPANANNMRIAVLASETVRFSANNQFIFDAANIESFRLVLGAGSDRVSLGAGNDRVTGGAGKDTLGGGAGDDVLIGGKGADALNGGAGADTVIYASPVTVRVGAPRSGTGEAAGDSFSSIEVFRFGGKNDNFFGGTANETAFGGQGNDTLNGSFGADTISGGKGNDVLTGGAAADRFDFENRNLGVDVIRDFKSGVDHIGVGLNGFGAGFIVLVKGANPQASQQFEPVFLYNTVNGHLSYDQDGKGGAAPIHFATLTGAPNLVSADLQFLFDF